jgi:hypothetical protein
MTTAITKRIAGRPPEINPDKVWPEVLGYIASGDALSTALQRLDPAPSYSWAKAQLRNAPDLQAAYRAAIEDRADALADDIIALADSEPPAHLEGPALSAWVQQLKLRVHAREWTASKLRPRVYGEKIDVSVQHTQISVLAALERAELRVIEMG